MARHRVLAWLVLVIICGNSAAAAQVGGTDAAGTFPLTVSVDPHRSIETGADLTFSVISILANLEALGFSHVTRKPLVRLPLRIATTVLLDHPLAIFAVVLQHEAYGHGGRAREFGSGAGFQMGSPWTFDALFKGKTRFGGGAYWERSLPPEDQLRVYIGGVESNARSATLIERDRCIRCNFCRPAEPGPFFRIGYRLISAR